MSKITNYLMLLVLFFVPWLAHSQSFSFSCDFEDETQNAEWVMHNGTSINKWNFGSIVNNGGMNSMYISDNFGSVHAYTMSNQEAYDYAYKPVTLSAGFYTYSYDWLCMGESLFDFMRVALAPASDSLTGGEHIMGLEANTLPYGWIALDGGSKLNQSMSWSTFSGYCTIETAGDYNLVFYWRNDNSGGAQPPAAVDNILFEMPSCPPPINLTVGDVNSDGATVSWNYNTDVSNWSIEYGEAGFTLGEGTTVVVYDTFYTFTGLTPDTPYDVYVKSECASEYSMNIHVSFRTNCGDIVYPYTESFETEAEYTFPRCWHNLSGNATVASHYYWNPHTTDGEHSLKLESNAVVTSPFAPLTTNGLELEFLLKKENTFSGKVVLGYASDLEDLSTMIIFDTINPVDNGINLYSYDLSSFDIVEGGYIVWKQIDASAASYYDDYSYYLDAVYINELTSCRRPTSVTATRVSYNLASFSWIPITDAAGYELRYGLVDDCDDVNNTTVTTYEDTITIFNLEANTDYYMWIRSICTDDTYSDWRKASSFKTQVSCAPIKYVTLDNITNSSVAMSWSYYEEVGAPHTQVEVSYRAITESDFTTVSTDNDYYIFTGLTEGTEYIYRLSTICSNDTANMIEGRFTTNPCGLGILGDNQRNTAFVPMGGPYKYSYSQMLYDANDLIGLDSIHAIAYHVKTTSGQTRNVTIYMGNTTQSSLTPETYIPISNMTEVATNINHTWNSGWCVIQLTTPFVYDGTSNLVIAIDDNTNAYNGYEEVYCHSGSSIFTRVDYGNPDPVHPSGLQAITEVPDIIFVQPCDENLCAAPALTTGDITSSTVELVWDANGDATHQVEYKLTTESDWTIAATGVGTSSYTVTGLQ